MMSMEKIGIADTGTLIFLRGKMGAGKSTQSKKLSKDIGVILISEDSWLEHLCPEEINSFEDLKIRFST